MLGRSLAGLSLAFAVAGVASAEDTRGTVTKVEDGSITVRTGGGFGKKAKAEERTFKVAKDVKVVRVARKGKEEVRLTLDELRTAVKVTNVFVTVTHDGDAGSEIKVGGGLGGGAGGREKKDDK